MLAYNFFKAKLTNPMFLDGLESAYGQGKLTDFADASTNHY
jgi:hypothetical protein